MPPREESRLVREEDEEEVRLLGVVTTGVQVEGEEGGSTKPWTAAEAQVKTRSTGCSKRGGARIGVEQQGSLCGVVVVVVVGERLACL